MWDHRSKVSRRFSPSTTDRVDPLLSIQLDYFVPLLSGSHPRLWFPRRSCVRFKDLILLSCFIQDSMSFLRLLLTSTVSSTSIRYFPLTETLSGQELKLKTSLIRSCRLVSSFYSGLRSSFATETLFVSNLLSSQWNRLEEKIPLIQVKVRLTSLLYYLRQNFKWSVQVMFGFPVFHSLIYYNAWHRDLDCLW